MDPMRELYQQLILDHNRKPRNFGRPEGTNREAEGYNPLCGDHYTIYLDIENDEIEQIGFEGSGCAISKSSASVMTETLKGKPAREALEIASGFLDLVKGDSDEAATSKLAVFKGVRDFPTRTKCATLAWHALRNAIENIPSTATTE